MTEFYVTSAYPEELLALPLKQIDFLVKFFHSYKREHLPEMIGREILPQMEKFLADNNKGE